MRSQKLTSLYLAARIVFSVLLSSGLAFSQIGDNLEVVDSQAFRSSYGNSLIVMGDAEISMPGSAGKYYFKFNIGAGVSFDDISMYMTAVPGSGGGSEENVTLDTGGLILSGSVGYHLRPDLILETTFGYQTSIETPDVEDADCSFSKPFLMGNIMKQFHFRKTYNLYYGGGFTINFPAVMIRESTSSVVQVKNEVNYGSSFCVNLIFGGEIKMKVNAPLYITIDGIIMLGSEYSLDKVTEDGFELQVHPYDDWEKVGSSQILFNMGLKYYL